VVAFILLLLIMRDQRKALGALNRAVAEDGIRESARSADSGAATAEADAADGTQQAASEGDRPAIGGAQPASGAAQLATAEANRMTAAVERGRITSLGGVTALIWLVILVLMAWH
jgi:hypothetical protein